MSEKKQVRVWTDGWYLSHYLTVFMKRLLILSFENKALIWSTLGMRTRVAKRKHWETI